MPPDRPQLGCSCHAIRPQGPTTPTTVRRRRHVRRESAGSRSPAGSPARHKATRAHVLPRLRRAAGSRRPLLPRRVRGRRPPPHLRVPAPGGSGGVVRRDGRLRLLGAHPPRGHRGRQPQLPAVQLAPGDPHGGDGRRRAGGPADHDGAGPTRARAPSPVRQPRLRPPPGRDVRAAGAGHRDPRARPGPGPRRVRLRRGDREAAAARDAGGRARRLGGGRRVAGGKGRRDDRELRPGLHRSRGRPGGHRCLPAHALPLARRPRRSSSTRSARRRCGAGNRGTT